MTKNLNLFLLLLLFNCSLSLFAQNVTSLTLINSTTNQDIIELTNESTIDLAVVGKSLNVRANVSGTVGSIVFQYDEPNISSKGNSYTATEGVAPYAMSGDSNGDYNSWTPSVGKHSIITTSYSEAGGAGTVGSIYTVNFTVLDNTTPEPTTDPNIGDPQDECQGAIFAEKNGILVMEVETLTPVTGWSKQTTPTGFLGNSFFMWDGNDNFNTPGTATLEFKFSITETGTYHFRWHSKIMHGTEPTESNDTWMKIVGANDFFGKNQTSIKYPNGGMFVQSNTVFEGTSKDGWMKVYSSGTTNWTWSSRTSDNDAHEIYATFNNPGVYSLFVSARSRYHAIDRIVLFKDEKYTVEQATAASQIETLCDKNSIPSNIQSENIDDAIVIYPNPVADFLNIKTSKSFNSIQIINAHGQLMMQLNNNDIINETIDVKTLSPGFYHLISRGENENHSISFIKK